MESCRTAHIHDIIEADLDNKRVDCMTGLAGLTQKPNLESAVRNPMAGAAQLRGSRAAYLCN